MDRFLFVGDDLALDFINTRVRIRGRDRDLLEQPADLDRWWTEAAQHYDGLEPLAVASDDADLERLRAFRDSLRAGVSSAVEHGKFDASMIARLNTVLANAHPEIARAGSGDAFAIRANRTDDGIPVSVALAAAKLVTEGEAERLHQCEGCIILFYDRTKSGTRRWCNTRCFDRARARQRRAEA